jgi:hypothetical protein
MNLSRVNRSDRHKPVRCESFEGFVQLSYDKGLICWYSARGNSSKHDIRTAPHDIRIAELTIVVTPTPVLGDGSDGASSDEIQTTNHPRM